MRPSGKQVLLLLLLAARALAKSDEDEDDTLQNVADLFAVGLWLFAGGPEEIGARLVLLVVVVVVVCLVACLCFACCGCEEAPRLDGPAGWLLTGASIAHSSSELSRNKHKYGL